MQGSRTPITSPNNTRNNRGWVVLPSIEQDVVMGDHNKVETVPRRGGQVRAKILPDCRPKMGTQQSVDVSGERFDIRGTKKEELLALTHDILKKQHTVSLGELMKLIPQLPRTLSQEVRGPLVVRETGSEVPEENPPGKHWGRGVTYPVGTLWVHCEFWCNSPPLYPVGPWWIFYERTHQFAHKKPSG